MSTPKLPDEHRLQDQLQVAFDEADRGEVAEWDLEAFLASLRQHLAPSLEQAKRGESKPLDADALIERVTARLSEKGISE